MPVSPLTITLFGPMRVLVQGEPMPRVRTRSVEWLLALLVLRHGRAVDRSWLAGTLWLDSEEDQGLHNLRNTLVHLRKALGSESGRLQSPTRDTLTLDLQGAEVDVIAFDTAIQAEDAASLHRAIALYSGPLLEGCYEEWVTLERESRAQACLLALETLASYAEQHGDFTEALGLLRRSEGMDGLRDATQRRLMQVLAANGDAPAALLTYREHRLRLYREMNVEPDAETTHLFQQIRATGKGESPALSDQWRGQRPREEERPEAQRPMPSAQHPLTESSLPHPITTLIGREEAVREVVGQIAASRLVTLAGTGGVGKTRLCIQVASEAEEDFPNGAAFVALAPLTDPMLLPSFLASTLGMRDVGTSEPGALLQALIGWLSAHPILLVLDNCEHLIEATAILCQTLLERCPHLHILATSRQRLGLTGEVVWRVPSLSSPDPESLPLDDLGVVDYVQHYPAVQLFVERTRMVSSTFRLTRLDEAKEAARICQRLDGIPLAIELAAARTSLLTLAQIASRLDDRFRLLTGGSRGVLSRHQTLRALIDWSYDLLDAPERALLCRLAVFAGGWTLDAAEQISTGEGIKEWEVLDLLGSLQEKSLVLFEEREGKARYWLLETVREYGQDRLAESGQEAYWRTRHQGYFLALAEEAAPRLFGPDLKEWLDRLEAEHDNLRASLTWSLGAKGKAKEARQESGSEDLQLEYSGAPAELNLRLAGALWMFWVMRGHLSEGRRWLQMAITQPGAEARTTVRANALNGAGSLAYRQGDYAIAQTFYEESLEIGRELGDKKSIAIALHSLGNMADARSDYEAARALFEQSLAMRRELGDRRGAAGTLHNLGNVASNQGEYEEAHRHYAESLAIRREVGDTGGMAGTLHSMGTAAYALGDHATAITFFQQSLEIKRELGDKAQLAGSLHNLGNIAYAQGDHVTARSHFEEALEINRTVGNRSWEATNLSGLGDVISAQGDYPTAQVFYEEGLVIRQELGEKSGIAESLEAFFSLAVAQGRMERAARLWGAAEALREALTCPLPSYYQEIYDRNVAKARVTLGESAFDAAREEGCSWTQKQVVAYALQKEEA